MNSLKVFYSGGWISLIAALIFAAGVIVLATSILAADDPTYPEIKNNAGRHPSDEEPTPLPRPDEGGAQSLSAARSMLSANDVLDRVMTAAETGDTDTLLTLSRAGDYCEQGFRGELPQQCMNDGTQPAGFIEAAFMFPVLMPAADLEKYISAILGKEPVQLTLVAQDVKSGNYYLVYKASEPVFLDGSNYNSLGIVVDPSEAEVIKWFRFIIPENNGLEWLQLRATEGPDEPQFKLIAPESVNNWPGHWGELGN